MKHRIVAEGLETYGVPTPWSDIRSIVLSCEPPVVVGDATVAEGYRQFVVDLANGDFLEIAEGSPSWHRVVKQLPVHRTLLVDDLVALLASEIPEDTVLWRG